MKTINKIFVIIFCLILLCTNISLAFDYKCLEDRPSYWQGDTTTKIGIKSIATTPEWSALYNGESIYFDKVNTKAGFSSTTPECILWLNKYSSETDFITLSGELNDDSYRVIKAALTDYFKKSQIENINKTVKDNYDKQKDSNNLDTNDTYGKGVDYHTNLYFSILSKNYYEIIKDSIATVQKMTAAAGYAKTTQYADNVTIQTKFKAADGNYIDFTDKYETKKKYSKDQIVTYLENYGQLLLDEGKNNNDLIAQWATTLSGEWITNAQKAKSILAEKCDEIYDTKIKKITGYTKNDLDEMAEENDKMLKNVTGGNYTLPENNGKVGDNVEDNIDSTVQNADDWINSEEEDITTLSQSELQEFSQTLYTILFTIGVVVAVIVGAIIGIKFMTGSVEEKADVKKLLIPYIVGCIVVFGAFAIWQLAVSILSDI